MIGGIVALIKLRLEYPEKGQNLQIMLSLVGDPWG